MTQGSDAQRAHLVLSNVHTRRRKSSCLCVCGKLVVLNSVPLCDRNRVVEFFVDNIRLIASWSLCF